MSPSALAEFLFDYQDKTRLVYEILGQLVRNAVSWGEPRSCLTPLVPVSPQYLVETVKLKLPLSLKKKEGGEDSSTYPKDNNKTIINIVLNSTVRKLMLSVQTLPRV